MALRAISFSGDLVTSLAAIRDNSIVRFAEPERGPSSSSTRGEYLRQLEIKFQWRRILLGLRDLATGWDSYGAPPPTRSSIGLADDFLDLLINEQLYPKSIMPSAEGGVGICFKVHDRYADLEFLNSGEIVGVRYEGTKEPTVWETDSSRDALLDSIKNIREYLQR